VDCNHLAHDGHQRRVLLKTVGRNKPSGSIKGGDFSD
jgi:hypothetical protein